MNWAAIRRAVTITFPVGRGKPTIRLPERLPRSVENLEQRILFSNPSLVQVQSIARDVPSTPVSSASTVSYLVTFNQPVTGVDPTDFRAISSDGTRVNGPITIAPITAAKYVVSLNGIRGNGTVSLNLVDNDSITDAASNPLGGPGSANGSFTGPSYEIDQTYPGVLSIDRTGAAAGSTSSTSVDFTVTFNKPVFGLSPANFELALGAGVSVSSPLTIATIDGSSYTVHVSGISGAGSLGVNLSNPTGIHDSAGNPLADLSRPLGFQVAQTFAVGAGPRLLRMADLNADGEPDIVVVNSQSNNIGVMIARPGSLFSAQSTYPASSPKSVAIADLDGDGIPDLVIANDSGIASTLRGHGDGTFAAPVTFVAGSALASVAVADFNGDGRPDLVFGQPAYNGQSRVSVILNAGGGQFSNLQTFATDGSPLDVAAADVNNDGLLDLVTANFSGGDASVLIGNGDGTFKSQKTFGLGAQAISVSVADLNGDGNVDLAALSFSGSYACILSGNGDGTFKAARTFATSIYPSSITIADISGDGHPDLLVTSQQDTSIGILIGHGDGGFMPQQTFAAAAASAALAIGDANGDGRPDLVVSNTNQNTLTTILATSPAIFISQTYQILNSGTSIAGTPSIDHFTLVRDQDDIHIDWAVGASSGQILIDNPSGLSINGLGATDVLILDYTHGNPLPNSLHLNGIFSLTGLQGANPLAGTTLDIAQSTIYLAYPPGQSPLSLIQQYLTNAYNHGTWTGTATATTGAITSSAAASSPPNTFSIGFADSASGAVSGQPSNTIELRYTPLGDANLDGIVNATDAVTMARNWNPPNTRFWDQGDFNFDGTINLADATLLQKNWNATAPAIPAVVAASARVDPVHVNPPLSNTAKLPIDLVDAQENATIPQSHKKEWRRKHERKRS